MNIVECIASIVKAIVNACTPDTDLIKNQKYCAQMRKKERKRRLRYQYKALFAKVTPQELQIIQLLCKHKNHWIVIPPQSIHLDETILHNNIEETLYQQYPRENTEVMRWNRVANRINPCIFSQVQKAFRKYGAKRVKGLPPFTQYEWYTPEEGKDV